MLLGMKIVIAGGRGFLGSALSSRLLADGHEVSLLTRGEGRAPTATTAAQIQWQPNGLVNSSATVFYGNCTINEFSPTDTRGSVSTSPFSATVADENGISNATGT